MDKFNLNWISYIQQLSPPRQYDKREYYHSVAEDPEEILWLIVLAKEAKDNLELRIEEVSELLDLIASAFASYVRNRDDKYEITTFRTGNSNAVADFLECI